MTAVVHPPLGVPETRTDLRNPVAKLFFGPADQAAWIRPALLGVTALAAVVYLWGLTISGYANTYYSAAALAASQSWAAWFFGSFDAANFITVDKPPLGDDADGPVGPRLRPELVEHPAARGAHGRRDRRRPVRRRAAILRPGGRDDRRGRHGAHPGRRPDLPLQQPGRRS